MSKLYIKAYYFKNASKLKFIIYIIILKMTVPQLFWLPKITYRRPLVGYPDWIKQAGHREDITTALR